MKLKEKDEALGPEETNKTKEGEESKSNDCISNIVMKNQENVMLKSLMIIVQNLQRKYFIETLVMMQ